MKKLASLLFLFILTACVMDAKLTKMAKPDPSNKYVLVQVVNDKDFYSFSIKEELEKNGFKVDLVIAEEEKSREVSSGNVTTIYDQSFDSKAKYQVTVSFHGRMSVTINGLLRDRQNNTVISRFQIKNDSRTSWTIMTHDRIVQELVYNFIVPSFS